MIELLEHNVDTYKSLCEEMEKHNKVALVQATGTGKSYIVSKYIEEHCNNALILVPANAIGDQWNDLLPNTDIKTYQAMVNGIDGEYDLIVADEMHHLGSEVWGQKFIEYFMHNPDQKVIGATATEIRYLDNARDMVEEIFEGVAVYGLSLPEAINIGVLPTFKYISAYYGTEEEYDEYKKKCDRIRDKKRSEELSKRLELCMQNQISIKDAIHENLNDENHRIIVFLNGICEIEQAIGMFHDIFPMCECNYVSSKENSKTNNEAVIRFQTSKEHIAILFAIDMLNEGVHIDGVDCVVMFRNTTSPQIYFQQLGRAMSARGGCEPTIFDFVCNSSNITTTKNTDGKIENVIRKINKEIADKKKRIIVKSYTKEIETLLEELFPIIKMNRFSDEEKDYICSHTEMTATEIGKILNRKPTTISDFARKNGIKLANSGRAYFSQTEDEYILQNASSMTVDEIAEKLQRCRASVVARTKFLGVEPKRKKGRITEAEAEFIKQNIKKMPMATICETIGKSQATVNMFCRNNGIRRKCDKGRCMRTKKVLQIEVSTGKVVKKFDSAKKAEDSFGTSVRNCLYGRCKTAYGYGWQYAE